VQLISLLPTFLSCVRPAGDRPAGEQEREGRMQPGTWAGSFHLLWGDPRPAPPGSPRVQYQLVPDTGRVVRLLVADSLLAPLGGARGLDGKRVIVTGEVAAEASGAVRVRSIRPGPSAD
jgi:hypothetical protein